MTNSTDPCSSNLNSECDGDDNRINGDLANGGDADRSVITQNVSTRDDSSVMIISGDHESSVFEIDNQIISVNQQQKQQSYTHDHEQSCLNSSLDEPSIIILNDSSVEKRVDDSKIFQPQSSLNTLPDITLKVPSMEDGEINKEVDEFENLRENQGQMAKESVNMENLDDMHKKVEKSSLVENYLTGNIATTPKEFNIQLNLNKSISNFSPKSSSSPMLNSFRSTLLPMPSHNTNFNQSFSQKITTSQTNILPNKNDQNVDDEHDDSSNDCIFLDESSSSSSLDSYLPKPQSLPLLSQSQQAPSSSKLVSSPQSQKALMNNLVVVRARMSSSQSSFSSSASSLVSTPISSQQKQPIESPWIPFAIPDLLCPDGYYEIKLKRAAREDMKLTKLHPIVQLEKLSDKTIEMYTRRKQIRFSDPKPKPKPPMINYADVEDLDLYDPDESSDEDYKLEAITNASRRKSASSSKNSFIKETDKNLLYKVSEVNIDHSLKMKFQKLSNSEQVSKKARLSSVADSGIDSKTSSPMSTDSSKAATNNSRTIINDLITLDSSRSNSPLLIEGELNYNDAQLNANSSKKSKEILKTNKSEESKKKNNNVPEMSLENLAENIKKKRKNINIIESSSSSRCQSPVNLPNTAQTSKNSKIIEKPPRDDTAQPSTKSAKTIQQEQKSDVKNSEKPPSSPPQFLKSFKIPRKQNLEEIDANHKKKSSPNSKLTTTKEKKKNGDNKDKLKENEKEETSSNKKRKREEEASSSALKAKKKKSEMPIPSKITTPTPPTLSKPKESILESLLPNEANNKKITTISNISGMKSNKMPPTLAQLNDARQAFNIANGFKKAYFSPLLQIDQYVKQTSKLLSLDIEFLLANLPPRDLCPPHLHVSELNRDEMTRLCRLMSRSAGKINYYKLFGYDRFLREVDKRTDETNANRLVELPPVTEELALNWVMSFTMSEALIFFDRIMHRLSMPFSQKIAYRYGNSIYCQIRVTFENDGNIESTDASYEACVDYVLHRSYQNSYQNYVDIKRSLHQYYVSVPGDDNENMQVKSTKPNRIAITTKNYDETRKMINDDQLLNEIYIKPITQKLIEIPMPKKKEIASHNHTLVRNKGMGENTKQLHPRFHNYESFINPEHRGHGKRAVWHKLLNEDEFKRKLKTLERENNISVDSSNLLKNN